MLGRETSVLMDGHAVIGSHMILRAGLTSCALLLVLPVDEGQKLGRERTDWGNIWN